MPLNNEIKTFPFPKKVNLKDKKCRSQQINEKKIVLFNFLFYKYIYVSFLKFIPLGQVYVSF